MQPVRRILGIKVALCMEKRQDHLISFRLWPLSSATMLSIKLLMFNAVMIVKFIIIVGHLLPLLSSSPSTSSVHLIRVKAQRARQAFFNARPPPPKGNNPAHVCPSISHISIPSIMSVQCKIQQRTTTKRNAKQQRASTI